MSSASVTVVQVIVTLSLPLPADSDNGMGIWIDDVRSGVGNPLSLFALLTFFMAFYKVVKNATCKMLLLGAYPAPI